MSATARDVYIELRRHLDNERVLAPLRRAVKEAHQWRGRLVAIRALYYGYLDAGEDLTSIDPYDLWLHDFWTPIERKLWPDVRSIGQARFLPQFPVGPFFIDFGDPATRVGIEADGRGFHDEARDRVRDQRLWDRYGWKVYRVSGAETFRIRPSPWEWQRDYQERYDDRPCQDQLDEVARAFFSTTSTGVACAIRDTEIDPRSGNEFLRAEVVALHEHRLADFPIGGL